MTRERGRLVPQDHRCSYSGVCVCGELELVRVEKPIGISSYSLGTRVPLL